MEKDQFLLHFKKEDISTTQNNYVENARHYLSSISNLVIRMFQ